MGASGTKGFENCLDDILSPTEHVIVPEPQNTIAVVIEPCVAAGVGTIAAVATAVDLDDQAALDTSEVSYVRTHGMLPAKPTTVQLAAPQPLP